MTSSKSPVGGMAMSMRTTMLISGRMISPFSGPQVIWNGLNRKVNVNVGVDQGNVSVS